MATVCITGPNRGIGLELARQFRARGDDVIAIVREPTPALIETGCEIVSGVDVTDAASTAILKDAFQGRSIDLLLNNAGIFKDRNGLAETDLDAVRDEFEVNTLGPLRVCQALAPTIEDGGKLATLREHYLE